MKYGSKYDIIYTIMNMREVIVMMIRPPSALPRTIQFHRKMSSFVHSTELLIFINAFRQLSAKRETDNHPLCGWATKVIPKNLLMWYNKVFKPIVARKEKEWQTKQIVYPILNGFVSTT